MLRRLARGAGCALLGLVSLGACAVPGSPGPAASSSAGPSASSAGSAASASVPPGPTHAAESGPVTPYQPGFKTLRFGPDDGKGAPEVDYSNVDEASQRLARELKRAAVPKHGCRAPVDGPNSFASVERRAEEYANCLLDSWRPWLAAHGAVDLPRIELRHCSLADNAKRSECTGKDGVTWITRTGVFYLHDGYDLWGREQGDIVMLLGRMVSALLQDHVRPEGGEEVLTMGVADTRMAQNRRRELQAECLAAGMLNASTDARSRKLASSRTYYDPGEAYWDVASQKYWHRRGLKGIVGECDAVVAAPELVSYHGR